ncbi:MAG: hypothetical protein KY476_18415 [Planctomycetes bacterium]|nr:hypothetical protein [Planctomycetota bacterium]
MPPDLGTESSAVLFAGPAAIESHISHGANSIHVTIVRGLAQFVDAENPILAEFVDDEFSRIDRADAFLVDPLKRTDYSAYSQYIRGCLLQGEAIPEGFSAFIYNRSAGDALLAFVHAHDLTAARFRRILWAEHLVAGNLWKQEHQFVAEDRVQPGVAAELEALSKHEQWWARLYVAEILVQHPEFQTPALVERLKDDPHELVRLAITRPECERQQREKEQRHQEHNDQPAAAAPLGGC